MCVSRNITVCTHCTTLETLLCSQNIPGNILALYYTYYQSPPSTQYYIHENEVSLLHCLFHVTTQMPSGKVVGTWVIWSRAGLLLGPAKITVSLISWHFICYSSLSLPTATYDDRCSPPSLGLSKKSMYFLQGQSVYSPY